MDNGCTPEIIRGELSEAPGGSWESDVQGIDEVSNPWAEQPLEAHRTE